MVESVDLIKRIVPSPERRDREGEDYDGVQVESSVAKRLPRAADRRSLGA